METDQNIPVALLKSFGDEGLTVDVTRATFRDRDDPEVRRQEFLIAMTVVGLEGSEDAITLCVCHARQLAAYLESAIDYVEQTTE